MSEQHDNLSDYGKAFQTKAISALITDKEFLNRIHEIIRADFFESDAHQWIVGQIIQYYSEYAVPPNIDVFKIQIRQDIDDEVFKVNVIDELKNSFKYLESPDLPFVKDKFLEFCKNQRMQSALLRSVDYLRDKNWDAISNEIQTAQKAGEEFDIGHDYFRETEFRLSDDARIAIKTPWDIINEVMDGGIGPGELGVIVAPTGGGKSWFLSALGAHAVRQGKNVAHYTLELSAEYTGRRYDSIFTKIQFQDLLHQKDRVTRYVDGMKGHGELIIKFYPPKTVTSRTLKTHIDKLTAFGKKPDLVIIDYADNLKHSIKSSENRYDEMGGIYEEVRSLAGECMVGVWTGSQTNRCHVLTDMVETPNGPVEIGSVSEGDKILTHDGFKKVTRVFPIEYQGVYKITTKSGKTVTVSANHEFPTRYGMCKSISTGLSVGEKLFIKPV